MENYNRNKNLPTVVSWKVVLTKEGYRQHAVYPETIVFNLSDGTTFERGVQDYESRERKRIDEVLERYRGLEVGWSAWFENSALTKLGDSWDERRGQWHYRREMRPTCSAIVDLYPSPEEALKGSLFSLHEDLKDQMERAAEKLKDAVLQVIG